MPLILSLSDINLVGQPSPTGATLDIPFANQKNLNDIVSGSSLITFTRASAATFVGSNGLIQTAAVNAPRFDHNPTTGESLGLLMEESRTNLLLQSQFAGSWIAAGSVLTANTVSSPDGGTTASTLREDNTTGLHVITQTMTKAASSLTYAASTFVKTGIGGSARNLRIQVDDGVSSGVTVTINPVTCEVVEGIIPFGTGFSATNLVCTMMPNGWKRFSIIVTANTGVLLRQNFLLANGTSTTYTGDNTSNLQLYGAQLELGNFLTSYIPTTTAAVTRSADVASITGANFTSWYNSTEGTINFQGNTASASNFFSIDDTTTNNRLTSYMASTTAPYFLVATGGTTVCDITSSAITANATFKQASAYKANDFAISTNGGTVSTDTSGALPTVNRIIIGANVTGSSSVNGTIRRLAYYPRRLSNTELQMITQ